VLELPSGFKQAVQKAHALPVELVQVSVVKHGQNLGALEPDALKPSAQLGRLLRRGVHDPSMPAVSGLGTEAQAAVDIARRQQAGCVVVNREGAAAALAHAIATTTAVVVCQIARLSDRSWLEIICGWRSHDRQ
jgi:hypothetical protein